MPDFKNSESVLLNIKNNKVNCENEIIDYKRCFKFKDKRDKLELIKDIVAFANTEGGYIVFGVIDKEFDWFGLDSDSDLSLADDTVIENAISSYIKERIGFQIGRYEIDGDTFLLLTIDKYEGDLVVFEKEGEYERTKPNGKVQKINVFHKGDIYGRIKSSSTRVNGDSTFMATRNSGNKIITNLDKVSRPYKKYINREDDFNDLFEALNNQNIRCAQVNGLGGIGKTSFVINFCDRVLGNENKVVFDVPVKYIIWITGKLNRFLPTGTIETIKESELSFDEMIDVFCNVLSIDTLDKDNIELNKEVLDKLSKYNSLIVMDNMETITDQNILKFTKNIPVNCKMIFTTRTDMSVTYRRIEITGFNKEQFSEYVYQCINDYSSNRNKHLAELVDPYLGDLIDLVQGSPILTSMVIYKICNGGNIEVIVDDLRKMKKNNSYYDSVMNFCFKSTFDNLNKLEKEILFSMSISDINNEEFSIEDLSFILMTDKSDINVSMMKLFSSSFCSQIDQNYICQPLIKTFCNKEFNKNEAAIRIDKISKRYYLWAKTKSQINSYESSLFNRAKAYDFVRKDAFLKIRDLKQKYDSGYPYEEIKEGMTKLIADIPDYAYLYFSRAKLEESAMDSGSEIRADYLNAIKLDNENDYYISEYAYYLSSIAKDKESAIPLFEKAIKINPYPNYYFGLAISLKDYYNNKEELKDHIDKILYFFNHSYFEVSNGRLNSFRNGRAADAHARFLRRIKRYKEALEVCEKGLSYLPRDERLNSLRGLILKDIDPNYVSDTQLRNMKRGIFSGIDNETAMRLMEMVDDD